MRQRTEPLLQDAENWNSDSQIYCFSNNNLPEQTYMETSANKLHDDFKMFISEWYLHNTPSHVEYLDQEIFCDPNDAAYLRFLLSADPTTDELTDHTWIALLFSMNVENVDRLPKRP